MVAVRGMAFLTVGTCPAAEEVIAQQTLNTLVLGIDNGKEIDEIRMGSTLNSVMAGTKDSK